MNNLLQHPMQHFLCKMQHFFFKPMYLIRERVNTTGFVCLLLALWMPPLSMSAQQGTGVPTISSFAPANGAVGTTVTIAGTNFNSTAANNVVFFGATRAVITAATTNSLTVTVPVGATLGPITVLNTASSLATASVTNFTPTFSPIKATLSASDFDPKMDLTTAQWPYQVALGDIDGDGKSDLVVANRAASSVSVFRNTSTAGTISFAAKVDFATAQEPRGLTLADIDGDGKLDVATTGGNLAQVAMCVLRNTSTSGSVSFATKLDINTSAPTYCVTSGDIDKDGKIDLIFGGSKMIIFRNTSSVGSVSFGTAIEVTSAINVNGLAVGDIDGDGAIDICATVGTKVSVLRNTSTVGTISLDTPSDYGTPSMPYGVTTGDWDGDGKLEIAATLLNASNKLSIFSSNISTVGNVNFVQRIDNNAPQNPYFVASGDLNGDGKADLVTANAGQNGTAANLSIYSNTATSGTASFAANSNLALGTWPYYVAIGDIDGDGKPDIVSSSVEGNVVSIFHNYSPSANADLSALTTTAGTLTPSFSAAITTYDATVSNATPTITVTPTKSNANATIQVRVNSGAYETVVSGAASSALSLNTGSNTVEVKVTAEDGATTKTYTLTVCRTAVPSVSIAITSGSQTICSGTSVTFTATPTDGGSSPAYQWLKGGVAISGATGATYTSTTLANNDAISVALTSNIACAASYLPVTSSATVMTVNAAPTVTAVANQTVCPAGNTTAVAFTGTGATSYTWTNSNTATGLAASGTGNIAAFTATNNTGAAITSTVTVTPVNESSGYAYITSPISNSVSVINTTTNAVVATIPIGADSGTDDAAVSPDGSRVYIANRSANTISVINTATNAIIATIATGGTGSNNLSVSPDGSRLYIVNANSNNVSVINTVTNALITTISVGAFPTGVAVGADGSRVYVTSQNTNNVSVINTATNAVITTIGVGSQPVGIWVSPDGSRLYVANHSSHNVSVINTATNAVVATVAVGTNPYRLSVTPDGSRVYVSNLGSNSVSVINTTTNGVITAIAVGSSPVGAVVSPDGSRVYVTNAGSNNVSVINTATNAVVATVAVNNFPTTCGNFVKSGALCPTGTPITFTLTVNPNITPSVSIGVTAGSTTICAGTSVTFTATPTNGGSAPTYQWKKNDVDISGATSATYTSTTLANNDAISVTLTSNIACADTLTATSAAIIMTVNAPTVSLSNTAATDCLNTATLSVSTTGTANSIQWYNGATLVNTATGSTPSTSGTTVAGTGAWGSDASSLAYSYNVFVDASSNVYVADAFNHRIQKWAPGATSGVTVAGGNGAGANANQLNVAEGVFVDASGNVYAVDVNNDRIQKWTPGATSGVTVAGGNGRGAAANQISSPAGIYVDASGNVYVADYYNSRIQKWTPGATTGITVAGGNGQGDNANQLAGPRGISMDASGNLYITDAVNNRIQKWALGATSGTTVAGGNGEGANANQLNHPNSVYSDASGNLYIADFSNHRIQKWAVGATSGTTVAGGNGQGANANQLNAPTGVYVNASYVYVADDFNNRIQRWSLGGINTSYTPTTAGSYTAVVTANSCSATTNAVTVNPLLTPSVSIAVTAGSQTSCAGTSVTFTATPTNGGSTPTYQWRKNDVDISGATSETYTSTTLANNDVIKCVLTSNACTTMPTATSTGITMTINTVPTVAAITGYSSVNVEATTALASTTSGGVWSSSNIAIATVNASTGVVTGVSGGTVTISYAVTNACGTTTVTKSIEVNAATYCLTYKPVREGNYLYLHIGLLASTTTFRLGDGNTQFKYKSAVLSNPIISSTVLATNGNYFGIDLSNPIVPSLAEGDSLVSFNFVFLGNTGDGLPISTTGTGTEIGVIRFNIDDATTSPNLRPYQDADAGMVIYNDNVTAPALLTQANNCGNYDLPLNTSIAYATPDFCPSVTTASVTLTGTSGGTYSSSPAGLTLNTVTGEINPSTSTVGTYSVYYDIPSSNGAQASATVTINAAPSITTQPTTSTTVCAGAAVNLSVAATGTALTYQWQKGGTNIDGATTANYSITTPAVSDAGIYTVLVSGTCAPTVTSGNAVVVINTAPSITTQPTASTVVCPNATVQLSVVATGTALTYQWQKGGVNITNATAANYDIASAATSDAGTYTVIIGGTCAPSVTSNNAVITLNTVPSITTQPTTSTTVCAGAAVHLSVAATGTALTYQWQKGGTNISGANTANYDIATSAIGDAATYTVIVSGTCAPSVTSDNAVVVINTAPSITTQPTATTTACAGTTVNLSVVATGAGLTYQWQKGGVNITNATAATYSIPTLATDNAGTYSVSISGTCPSPITSGNAVVVVNTLPTAITGTPSVYASFTTTLTNTLAGGTWSSSNTAVATVNASTGLVTGIAPGTATISYSVTNACGTNTVTQAFTVIRNTVQVSIKAFLQGAYSTSTGKMTDGLRSNNAVPSVEPYTGMSKFTHVGYGGGEVVDNANVLTVTGDNAIVDWVFVELRDKTTPSTVLQTRAALIQRDGDIVDMDGVSPLTFLDVIADNYHIAVRHRNHLGFRTATSTALSSTTTAFDFTNGSKTTFGTNALKLVSSVYVMYSGNGDANAAINAVDKNGVWLLQNGQFGYLKGDYDMNGVVNAVDINGQWLGNNSKVQQLD